MIPPLLIIAIASTLLVILVTLEQRGGGNASRPRLVVKTALSMLFVATALVQTGPGDGFYTSLIIGLVLCLLGDVFLALPGRRMFLLGLVSFLLGHLAYVVAFISLSLSSASWLTVMGGLVTATVSGAVFFLWLRPHLGKMLLPVSAYVVVITAMVIGAWTVLGDSGLAASGRSMIFSGALLFYLSDLAVARERFVKKDPRNALIGLPLYYAGQFLLAFSPGAL